MVSFRALLGRKKAPIDPKPEPNDEGTPQDSVSVPTITETRTAEISAPATMEAPVPAAPPQEEVPTQESAPLVEESKEQAQHPEQLNIDFPGKEPSERFRFYFRQHWVRLMPPFLKAAAWTGVLFFASLTQFIGYPLDDTTRRFVLVPMTLIFVFFQMQLMRRWYEYFLHIIIVSDLKIHRMKRRFLLMENERSVDIPSIRDINREQRGAFQVLMGYGSLVLDTAQGELIVHFVPALSKMHDALVVQRDEKRNGNGNGHAGGQEKLPHAE